MSESELVSEGFAIRARPEHITRTREGKTTKMLAAVKLTACRGTAMTIDRQTARQAIMYCCRTMKNEVGKLSKEVAAIYDSLEFDRKAAGIYQTYVKREVRKAKQKALKEAQGNGAKGNPTASTSTRKKDATQVSSSSEASGSSSESNYEGDDNMMAPPSVQKSPERKRIKRTSSNATAAAKKTIRRRVVSSGGESESESEMYADPNIHVDT
eukprot:Nk52_evm1s1035 gene=Nk52_evmTU1s1035